ncbi:anthranilate synthase component I family protein [Adhaeretor mobilis]|uniref:Aminodeoxychorismate synthase component 1 n=1 Tax=Adhaeretor mobilis TaxID=1930276 RepID=A0A517MWT0_9BACT|nr:anthranilate synthase component I family protein [Adhaeretor mobilis]QDS99336.1 Aminodeoxychorismate synthase component 1 [Adhaeretor mobilis]
MSEAKQSADYPSTSGSQMLPLAQPLPKSLTAVEAYRRLLGRDHVVFFDSALPNDETGRYSFVAVDPFHWLTVEANGSDALGELARVWQPFSTPTRDDLPPFQGGAAGLLSYDLARSLEKIDPPKIDDLPVPAMAVGLYDVVLSFDHSTGESWIVSQGFPELNHHARLDRAEARTAQILQWLEEPPPSEQSRQEQGGSVQVELQAAQHPIEGEVVTSNFTAESYGNTVQRGIDYIYAGDAFQVNLAQRLLYPATALASELYLRLRERNAAPYAGFLDLGETQICSASPECFLTCRGGQVETRPIKGTRRRSPNAVADLFTGDDLRGSEKDRAENVMIVDLLRNDLSRVCRPESVHVAQLCSLETYAFVKHLTSVVRGELAEGVTPIDLLRASFPGGSITGAPKVRAMEIIAELEPTARGAYCGSLFYLGFDGQLDSSILIRTVTATGGWWQLPVGGGIVSQSSPSDEYRETWHKARGLLEALR